MVGRLAHGIITGLQAGAIQGSETALREGKRPLDCIRSTVTHTGGNHTIPEPELLRMHGEPTSCSRRLLTIHAHPDDESSKGGGSAARYAAEGVGTVLICCTGLAALRTQSSIAPRCESVSRRYAVKN